MVFGSGLVWLISVRSVTVYPLFWSVRIRFEPCNNHYLAAFVLTGPVICFCGRMFLLSFLSWLFVFWSFLYHCSFYNCGSVTLRCVLQELNYFPPGQKTSMFFGTFSSLWPTSFIFAGGSSVRGSRNMTGRFMPLLSNTVIGWWFEGVSGGGIAWTMVGVQAFTYFLMPLPLHVSHFALALAQLKNAKNNACSAGYKSTSRLLWP